jgi:predicted RNA-binding Zn-ribbon protein involved in translation (DUF1610 family)
MGIVSITAKNSRRRDSVEYICHWCEEVIFVDEADMQHRNGMVLFRCPECGEYNEYEEAEDDRV